MSPKMSNNFFLKRGFALFIKKKKKVFDRSFIRHFSLGAAGLSDKA